MTEPGTGDAEAAAEAAADSHHVVRVAGAHMPCTNGRASAADSFQPAGRVLDVLAMPFDSHSGQFPASRPYTNALPVAFAAGFVDSAGCADSAVTVAVGAGSPQPAGHALTERATPVHHPVRAGAYMPCTNGLWPADFAAAGFDDSADSAAAPAAPAPAAAQHSSVHPSTPP